MGEKIYFRKSGIVGKSNQDLSITVFDLNTTPEKTYHLRGLSATVWTLIDGRRCFKDILSEIPDKKTSSVEMQIFCRRTLTELQDLGLIELASP